MPICNARHTNFQPSLDEWKCPKCGAGSEDGDFIIENPDEDAHDECDKMHANDEVRCHACGYTGYGTAVSTALKRKYDLVTCPCCKGKGSVPRKKAEKIK